MVSHRTPYGHGFTSQYTRSHRKQTAKKRGRPHDRSESTSQKTKNPPSSSIHGNNLLKTHAFYPVGPSCECRVKATTPRLSREAYLGDPVEMETPSAAPPKLRNALLWRTMESSRLTLSPELLDSSLLPGFGYPQNRTPPRPHTHPPCHADEQRFKPQMIWTLKQFLV